MYFIPIDCMKHRKAFRRLSNQHPQIATAYPVRRAVSEFVVFAVRGKLVANWAEVVVVSMVDEAGPSLDKLLNVLLLCLLLGLLRLHRA